MKFPIIQEEFYDYLIDKNIPVHKWSDDGDPINICELDRIRERAQEIKNQSKPSGEGNDN